MATAQRRTITSRDVLNFRFCDDPQVSPDGRAVAWVQTAIDAERNRYCAQIMLTNLHSGQTTALTAPDGNATQPRWSPDGSRLLYLAPAGGPRAEHGPPPAISLLDSGHQLMLLEAVGGQPRRLTNLRGGVRAAAWSPDGTRIAFLTMCDPQIGLETIPSASVAEDPYTRFNRDVVVTGRIRWKSDSLGFLGNYYQQLAVVDADNGAVSLIAGGEHDYGPPCWSPDNRTIACVANLADRGEAVRSASIWLFDANADAEQQPRRLLTMEELRGSDLSWSPDGATLAFCGHNEPLVGHYGTPHLWTATLDGAEPRCLTHRLDMAIGDYSRNYDMRRYGGDDRPRWSADGTALTFLVNQAGNVNLYRLTVADGALQPLTTGERVISAFSVDQRNDRIVALLGDNHNPGDLYVLTPPEEPQRLTDVNGRLLSEVELAAVERFSCQSGDVTIDGWVYLPVGREAGRRYPTILYTGGGPGGMRAGVFVHEWQTYAAAGYVVLNCNTRGNHGYGQPFSAATRGKWGDLDGEDAMAFLRAACDAFDFIDPQRLAVAGGSYGGYSAAWLTIHYPGFRAAVVDRALTNRTSQVGTSDMGFLLDQVEFDRELPWQHLETLIHRSPALKAHRVTTPTLVVHSALDHRCAVEQGEQYYMALKLNGVPTELVRFPDESHELSRAGKPWHRIFRLDRYLAWFARWL